MDNLSFLSGFSHELEANLHVARYLLIRQLSASDEFFEFENTYDYILILSRNSCVVFSLFMLPVSTWRAQAHFRGSAMRIYSYAV